MKPRHINGRKIQAGNDHSPEPLVSAADLEQLRLITLQHKGRLRRAPYTPLPGVRLTRLRGQGMELHDLRPYQTGDDVRHIDWRATARSGKPVTKVFVEERARSLFLIVDRCPSMMFGTRRELKAATAVRVAAILAFAALAERESVTGIILGDTPGYFPPRHSLEGLLPLLQAAAAPAPGPRRDTARATVSGAGTIGGVSIAAFIERHAERGAALCMISDFHEVLDDRAGLADYLPSSGRFGALAVRILDEAEQHLKPAGTLRLVPPQGGAPVLVDTGNPTLRKLYQELMTQRELKLRRQCERHNTSLFTVTNYGDPLAQLEDLI